MELTVTNENLIIHNGGHPQPGFGSQTHYPIFKDAEGNEYIFRNGITPSKFGGLANTRRETVTR